MADELCDKLQKTVLPGGPTDEEVRKLLGKLKWCKHYDTMQKAGVLDEYSEEDLNKFKAYREMIMTDCREFDALYGGKSERGSGSHPAITTGSQSGGAPEVGGRPEPKGKMKVVATPSPEKGTEVPIITKSMAGVAAAAAGKSFTDETKPPALLPGQRAGSNVTYKACWSLSHRGLVWSNRKPTAVAAEARRLVVELGQMAPKPCTAMDFSGAYYTEKDTKLNQAAGSVRPEKYLGDSKFDFSICFLSTTHGCKDSNCRHRHKFFCLAEAMAAYKAGAGNFVWAWAKALEKNGTAENNIIPCAPNCSFGTPAKVPAPPGGSQGGRGRGRPTESAEQHVQSNRGVLASVDNQGD